MSNEPHGTRPRVYKIRRLVHPEGLEGRYEFLSDYPDPLLRYNDTIWMRDIMDGFTFMTFQAATKVCERLKTLNRRHDVVYHSVIPA